MSNIWTIPESDFLKDVSKKWQSLSDEVYPDATLIIDNDAKKKQLVEEEQRAVLEAEIKRAKELDRLLNIEFKKLDLKDGDTLIVQLTREITTNALRELISQVRKLPIITQNKIHVFIVPNGMNLEGLDEKEMNDFGWYRRGDARRLLRPYDV